MARGAAAGRVCSPESRPSLLRIRKYASMTVFFKRHILHFQGAGTSCSLVHLCGGRSAHDDLLRRVWRTLYIIVAMRACPAPNSGRVMTCDPLYHMLLYAAEGRLILSAIYRGPFIRHHRAWSISNQRNLNDSCYSIIS